MISRKCICCKKTGQKKDPLRIAFNGVWFFDFLQIAHGRAVYLHNEFGCLNNKIFLKAWPKVIEKFKSDGKFKEGMGGELDLNSLLLEGKNNLESINKIGASKNNIKKIIKLVDGVSSVLLQNDLEVKKNAYPKKQLRL